MTVEVLAIKALTDNYIWLIVQAGQAIVIDPGEANLVIQVLKQQNLSLKAILITHHHHDHTAGIAELVALTNAPVYGPALETIPCCTVPLNENDIVAIDGFSFSLKVINTPGHTRGHIVYFGELVIGQPVTFCGDTLFACGCGRIFEGNSTEMYQSIEKFKKMPQNTLIYCAHEYTIDNIKWALTIDCRNKALQDWAQKACELRQKQLPTVPTALAHELKTNPFLRVDQLAVIQAAQVKSGGELIKPEDVFAVLRDSKNHF